ncbi:DUF1343 domain-containing protein [Panacibacter ginsenosidivorans]|uniref:DUF1343 domain-containing protein n=1 Tax=Panacibacter ginsenosidivorans TaxID=1813871 RepID=A0A5B8V819_9BACT|nr:DUF1343 domain-containing protein [Panacibacter ginsenosidivorans]QEC67554.1 DUF1343 domain-containing protein [Panacibacter ginsenosidivorans]
MQKIFFFLVICIMTVAVNAQPKKAVASNEKIILPGAYQTTEYLPLLKGKKVGVFANQTSVIGNTHLVDSLQRLGVNVTKIFAPEHGFRGTADAGENIKTYIDEKTGITVVSLYGAKLKPAAADLKDVDIMLFDIQDVGVRFYTFISSLQYFIESAIQNNLPVIVLDRPNPNGFYVDGPVLDSSYKSFVGMQPVPVVYGMTIGEYAKMLLGEEWLPWKTARQADGKISLGEVLGFEEEHNNFRLTVIKCKNYTHKSRYVLPVKPSPNLADMDAIYWYPSTCFFEGTVLSEGRGTEHPFQIFGHPDLPDSLYAFTPKSNAGAQDPKWKDKVCYGWNLAVMKEKSPVRIQLKWLIRAYQLFPDKENFFIKPKRFNQEPEDYFFNKLAGNDELMQQLIAGKTEDEICKSWQPKLEAFKKIRKKYLLYSDF